MIELGRNTNLISILSEGSELHQMSRKLAHQPVEINIDTFGHFSFAFFVLLYVERNVPFVTVIEVGVPDQLTIRAFRTISFFLLYYFARISLPSATTAFKCNFEQNNTYMRN